MSDLDTYTSETLTAYAAADKSEETLGLIVLWSLDEPGRIGEFIGVPNDGRELLFGRGGARSEDPAPRAAATRLRPGHTEDRPAFSSRRISRAQLLLRAKDGNLHLENIGRCELRHAGDALTEVSLPVGAIVELKNAMVFLVARRPGELPEPLPGRSYPSFDFGEADAFGLVGESPAMWGVREKIGFVAGRNDHVLVCGDSGTGKELVANAIHAHSDRKRSALVSRNAATFPDSLIDAELFGNVKDYPNPGMPDRPGLIGQADGSTLFLDEVGELSTDMQAHLLRVLDNGEHQRLGESESRRSDLRLVAATNRDPGELKHDFLARLRHRIELPSLNDRREDIPLLVRSLMRRIAREDPMAKRFFERDHPRLAPSLVRALVRHQYTTHVRELESLLWKAIMASRGNFVDLADSVEIRPRSRPVTEQRDRDPTPDEIRVALKKHDGIVSRAWRDLGLRNRYQLTRLMKKLGVERPT